MITYIILGVIACLFLVLFIIQLNKTHKTELELQDFKQFRKQYNELQTKQHELEQDISEKIQTLDNVQITLDNLNIQKNKAENEISLLNARSQDLQKQNTLIQNNIKELQGSADQIYSKALQSAQSHLDLAIEKTAIEFQEEQKKYQEDYLKVLQDLSVEFIEKTESNKAELNELNIALEKMRSVVKAAREEQIRAAQSEENKAYYQIQLSDLDLKEIQKIRDILPYMRNERPLCKAIWENYYRAPFNDLLYRIMDTGQIYGIYKITNTFNSKSYIGQAVNLPDRIRNHVKAGLGIDTPNSILYKAMKEDGVENFSFEILEYCSKDELNEKEKFWIEYFDSQSWGYNMTGGGSATR